MLKHGHRELILHTLTQELMRVKRYEGMKLYTKLPGSSPWILVIRLGMHIKDFGSTYGVQDVTPLFLAAKLTIRVHTKRYLSLVSGNFLRGS